MSGGLDGTRVSFLPLGGENLFLYCLFVIIVLEVEFGFGSNFLSLKS